MHEQPVHRAIIGARRAARETGPVLPPPGTPGTDLPVRSALPALADALSARGCRRARGSARHRARRRSSRSPWPAPCRGGSSSPSRAGWPPAPPRAGWPRCWARPSGGRVGYSVRGESRRSAATRIEVVTTGLLVRRLQADPELSGVDAVVLDECHERHLDTDLALAFCLDVRAALRPDLQLLAMSATAQAQRLAALLGGDGDPAPVVEATGALHDDRRRLGPAGRRPSTRRTASGSTRGCSPTSPRPSAGRWPSRPATCWSSCPAPARSAPSPAG